MSIFVSGATGFLGRAVVREFQRVDRPVLELLRNVAETPSDVPAKVVDFSTGAGLNALPWDKCDGFIHLAAAGVKHGSRNLTDAVEVNVIGMQRLLNEMAAQQRIVPIVITRTYYEHFLSKVPEFRENTYVVTKAAGTTLAKAWSNRHPKFPVTAATIFQVYGPGDDPRNVLPYAAACLRAGRQVQLGSGRAEKDWIHLEDAAGAICAMLDCSRPGWNEWDAGTGVVSSVRQMVETLAEVAGVPPTLLNFDASLDRSDADIKARAEKPPLGWTPRTGVPQGLLGLWRSTK